MANSSFSWRLARNFSIAPQVKWEVVADMSPMFGDQLKGGVENLKNKIGDMGF